MPLSVTMHRLIQFLRHAHFVKAKLEIFQKCSEIICKMSAVQLYIPVCISLLGSHINIMTLQQNIAY